MQRGGGQTGSVTLPHESETAFEWVSMWILGFCPKVDEPWKDKLKNR